MATARIINGIAMVGHVNGKPVDSEGREIEDAPGPTPDTPPHKQPTATLQTPEDRLANAMVTALAKTASAVASAPSTVVEDETDSEEEDGLPSLGEMQAHLAKITSVDEIKALRKTDKRKGAKPLYAARLAELGE